MSTAREALVVLGAVHSLGLILMAPSLPTFPAQIVFHMIPVNLAAGKGIGFPCTFPFTLPLALSFFRSFPASHSLTFLHSILFLVF